MTRSHRYASLALALCLALTGLGCGDDSTSPENRLGVYLLESLGGEKPPILLVQIGTSKTEIMAASLTLITSTTCRSSVTTRETSDGQAGPQDTHEAGCTYQVSGTGITFDFGDDDIESGTISGKTITLTDGTSEGAVFRKQ